MKDFSWKASGGLVSGVIAKAPLPRTSLSAGRLPSDSRTVISHSAPRAGLAVRGKSLIRIQGTPSGVPQVPCYECAFRRWFLAPEFHHRQLDLLTWDISL